MKKNQITHSFCEQVLDRLARRKELAKAVGAIVDSESAETGQFVQEKDIGGPCIVPNGVGTHLFVCSSTYCQDNTFSCPPPHTNFECNASNRDYNDCNKVAGEFQCNQTDPEPQLFSCQQVQMGDAADYFDCRTFVCGWDGNGSSESFDCDSIVDFVCGGNDYDCVDNFDCTAGHGFSCTNKHECGDQFTCSGGTVEGCTEDGKEVAVSCDGTKHSNVKGYSPCLPVHKYDNNVPGDFICAYPGGIPIPDVFDCRKNFDCKAVSDFSCADSGEFTCAQQGGGENDFQCLSKAAPFECYSLFVCASASLFKCGEDDVYECKNVYAECKSKTDYDCKKDFLCFHPFDPFPVTE